jgi:hypothetical protein
MLSHDQTSIPRKYSISSIYRRGRASDGRVAYLRMSGRWLEQLGFARGARVLVTAEHGKLVVTLAPPTATKEATQVRRHRPRKLTPYLALASVRRRRELADTTPGPKPRDDGRGCDRPL